MEKTPIIIGPGLGMMPPRKLRRLGKSLSQILIAVLLVPLPFDLLIGGPLAGNLPTVRNIVPHLGKATDRPGKGDVGSNATYC